MIKSLMFLSFFLVMSYLTLAQTVEEIAIVEEGKKLYRLEMASWNGTDLFRMKYANKLDQVGGYVSYETGDTVRCIFFTAGKPSKVILSISFDSTYNIEAAQVDASSRELSPYESEIVDMRQTSLAEINSDTLFKKYSNTNLNLIPVVDEKGRRVYVLTGPEQNGVVIFGNDYLLTFDDHNNVLTKKKIHQNLIAVQWGSSKKKVIGSSHTHLPETADLITPTDICTLMLYQKFTGWETHMVVSWKYISTWHCHSNALTVIPQKELNKSVKDGKKRN